MTFKSLGTLLGAVSLSLILNTVSPAPESVPSESVGEFVLKPRFPSTEEMMSMYIDCDHKTYNGNTFSYTKTSDEISRSAEKRKNLENMLRRYFDQNHSPGSTDSPETIYDPLGGRGHFDNSFNNTRIRENKWKERHDAIDIFAPLGSEIYAPVEGVVVASADDWQGRWDKRKGLVYENGGLGELSGNGIILFNPSDSTYYFMIHMKEVYVNTGDVIPQGTVIGTVGETGNALSPYSKPHLHLAKKKSESGCGVADVLTASNPYKELLEARRALRSANQNDF